MARVTSASPVYGRPSAAERPVGHAACRCLRAVGQQFIKQYGDVCIQAARHAICTWYQTAQALREVTTDTCGQLNPRRRESRPSSLGWTGRLTYIDPAWTLGTGTVLPVRAGRGGPPTLG